MSVKLCCIFLCVVMATGRVHGAGSSVCPESKKLYPGDCRLFYKCVPLSESAQAYVWVPSRCTAGLVYEPRLETCVIPGEGWECNQQQADEEFDENSLYSLKEGTGVEDAIEITDHPLTSTVQNGIYMSGFKDDDKLPKINFASSSGAGNKHHPVEPIEANSVPLSAVNIPELDSIGTQMHRLTQLINSLKAANDVPGPERQPLVPVGYSALPKPLDLSFPLKQENPQFAIHEPNLLPAQIYKITAQLISQGPTLYRPSLNLPTPQTKIHSIKYNTDQVVSDLYQKYLANTTFLRRGEFIKSYANKHVHNRNKVQHCHIGDRLPNLEDCSKYYICKSGSSLISFTCPSKLAFNKYRKLCDVNEFKKCVAKAFEVDIDDKMEDGYYCEEEGRIADPTSIFSYIICVRREDNDGWREHRVKCPGNMEYCVQKKICLSKAYCQ